MDLTGGYHRVPARLNEQILDVARERAKNIVARVIPTGVSASEAFRFM